MGGGYTCLCSIHWTKDNRLMSQVGEVGGMMHTLPFETLDKMGDGEILKIFL